MEILTVLIYVGGLILLGILPVISRVLADRRPSPYGQSWAHVEQMQPQAVTVAQFQQNIQMEQIQQKVNEIPVFSADDDISFEPERNEHSTMNEEISFESERDEYSILNEKVSSAPERFNHSIPDQEMMKNIESLVASFQSEFEEGIENEESSSPLTPNEYREVAKRFGENVASKITATPSQCFSSELQQVMIGLICIKDNEAFLRYREEEVMLKGKIPLYDGEVILVKGHFVKPGLFHVMNFEDAETAMHYQEETAIM